MDLDKSETLESMLGNPLDRVRNILAEMGYTNVSEDVLLELWRTSQEQILNGNYGVDSVAGYEGDVSQHSLHSLEEFQQQQQQEQEQYPNTDSGMRPHQHPPPPQQQPNYANPPFMYTADHATPAEGHPLVDAAAMMSPPAAARPRNTKSPSSRRSVGLSPRSHWSSVPSPRAGGSVVDYYGGEGSSVCSTCGEGRGAAAASGDPLRRSVEQLAALGLSLDGGGSVDPRSCRTSVIYVLDAYDRQRYRTSGYRKSDPVAKFHGLQEKWKKDKFLTQQGRRRLMWDTRFRLAERQHLSLP